MTEHALGEDLLGEARAVHVYMPAGVAADEIEVLILLADGGSASSYAELLEPMVAAGTVGPAAIVGIANGGQDFSNGQAGNLRGIEYLYGFHEFDDAIDPERFGVHLGFFVDDVPAWARSTFGLDPKRTYVSGSSNGGAFAATVAALRPYVVDGAIAMSSGWTRVNGLFEQGDGPLLYMSAGLFEPGFLKVTRETADFAKTAGRTVRFDEWVMGHDPVAWGEQFVIGLSWLESQLRD